MVQYSPLPLFTGVFTAFLLYVEGLKGWAENIYVYTPLPPFFSQPFCLSLAPSLYSLYSFSLSLSV